MNYAMVTIVFIEPRLGLKQKRVNLPIETTRYVNTLNKTNMKQI